MDFFEPNDIQYLTTFYLCQQIVIEKEKILKLKNWPSDSLTPE